jgi:hypothetical protein
MRVRFFLGGSAALIALGSGCGSDDAGDGGASVPLAEVPAKFASAACAALDACFGPAAAGLRGAEDCVTSLTAQLADALPTIQDGIESGRAHYAAAEMGACLAAMRDSGCELGEALESEACHAALDGRVELGGECENDLVCAGDAHCKSMAACPGICTAGGVAGAQCEDDAECAAGLACSADTLRCYEPAAAGQPCTGSAGCTTGLFCVGGDEESGKSGVCRRAAELWSAPLGTLCDPGAGVLCEPGAACAFQGIATPSPLMLCVREVESGADCSVAVPDMCPDGDYCAVPAGSLDGTCTPLPADGESCGTWAFEPGTALCAPYTRCEAGTCRARKALGSSCQVGSVCLSESCVANACAAQGACG